MAAFERFLRGITIRDTIAQDRTYLRDLPIVRHLYETGGLTFEQPVTFLVGENGTGKSTLLEGMAVALGFNPEGGTRNFRFSTRDTHAGLDRYLNIIRGAYQPRDGFFLRAEGFYNVASYIDDMADDPRAGREAFMNLYGGKSLHDQSHGESFLALVLNRFRGKGLYVLDEPEAALSPTRQMALLRALHDLTKDGAQFIIATHSPILTAFPDAAIYELDADGIRRTPYRQTLNYQMTRRFLEQPERMLEALFAE